MHYFKHSELTTKYHVSLKTVHNWIDAAKQGKSALKLHEERGRIYVANTPGNLAALEELAQRGKKFRNTRFHKCVSPKPEFYKYYTRRQILEIISSIEVNHEIPFKYSYIDGGAESWEKLVLQMEDQEDTNSLNGTLSLVQANVGALDLLIKGHRQINVIDIGVGNARPVKDLLEHLIKRGVLHRYIAIDISQSMLDIAERNVRTWFGGKVQYEGHIRDIDFERFDDILLEDMLGSESDQTINLVLLLGGTPSAFPVFTDALRIIQSSMGVQDLLVYTGKPDTEASRRYFNFNRMPGTNPLSLNQRLLPDLLNIEPAHYEADLGFSEEKRMRFARIRLKTALTIDFQFEEGERRVLLEKGDSLLLWRAWHKTSLERISEFEKGGFRLLQSSMTKDRQYLLSIFGMNTQNPLDS